MRFRSCHYRAIIVETEKRKQPFNVCTLFTNNSVVATLAVGKSPDQLLGLVKSLVTYTHEPAGQDYWQTVEETLQLKTGDCEDGAILLANLLVASGQPYYKVLIYVFDAHVTVQFDGRWMDWTGLDDRALDQLEATSFRYCFNRRHAYTTLENVDKWKK